VELLLLRVSDSFGGALFSFFLLLLFFLLCASVMSGHDLVIMLLQRWSIIDIFF
jgi:hypothetical protein